MSSANKTFTKTLRMERELVNEFSSVKQFLNGDAPKDNNVLRDVVVNKAIQNAFSDGPLKALADMCDDSRLNGSSISVNISAENWQSLVFLLNDIDRKLDEGDLIQFCLKCYIKEIKVKRCLP